MAEMDTYTRQDGTRAPCNGLNHTDKGEIVIHDRCGAEVARREDGKVFNVRATGLYGARKYTCWDSRHVCDPDLVEIVAVAKAKRVAAGGVEKGCTVTVVKGRKVAKGTTGIVFWKGEDAYGTARIGFRTDSGETVWIAEGNCHVISAD